MSIKIGIVDDKQINRLTVKEKLFAFKEVVITVEANNGKEFLSQLKTTIHLPDVVLMDLEMPEMNGIETIAIATANYPNIKFIVLTVFEDNTKLFEAIKAGASGYLLKDDTATNLMDAITNVYEFNGIPMSPAIARKAFEVLKSLPMQDDEQVEVKIDLVNKKMYGLSQREMDVLKELVSGKSYKTIGEKLFISAMTVRKHVSNIYLKLHVNTRAQLINIAHKENWV